jgi:hypothetical protein
MRIERRMNSLVTAAGQDEGLAWDLRCAAVRRRAGRRVAERRG